jgi:hypothetical protein
MWHPVLSDTFFQSAVLSPPFITIQRASARLSFMVLSSICHVSDVFPTVRCVVLLLFVLDFHLLLERCRKYSFVVEKQYIAIRVRSSLVSAIMSDKFKIAMQWIPVPISTTSRLSSVGATCAGRCVQHRRISHNFRSV